MLDLHKFGDCSSRWRDLNEKTTAERYGVPRNIRGHPPLRSGVAFSDAILSSKLRARQEKMARDFFQISFTKSNGLVEQEVAFNMGKKQKNLTLLPANSFLGYARDADGRARQTSTVVVASKRIGDGVAKRPWVAG